MNRHERKANRGGSGFIRGRWPHRLLFCASAAAVAVAVSASSGSAASRPSLARPTGLQSFLQRLDEPRRFAGPGVPEYSRSPSFAWAPVRGAARYEFQLSTSNQFRADHGLIWSGTTQTTPATTLPLSLPWITGDPASLYWRVRAVSGGSVSPWSDAQPFAMRAPSLPTEWRPDGGSPTDMPGYVRWHPVDGATSYQVWFEDTGDVVTTITNVADEREYYALPAWNGVVHWRVRAIRRVYGSAFPRLPRVSRGPWSPEYTWTNTWTPGYPSAHVHPLAAVSDRVSTPGRPGVHSLVPALLFAGGGGLHRVYVFSDSDCMQPIFRGSVVRGPAYAPRISGPLALPESASNLASGRYYDAVVPVRAAVHSGKAEYRDAESPRVACQAKRVLAFGKNSAGASPVPQAIGLSPAGRLLASAASVSSFYGPPLVTWTAAPAAAVYDVEWSRNLNPWHPAGHIRTHATSALLPVAPGTWWYRVRGIDPGNKHMTWSNKVPIHIAPPTYSVIWG